MGGKDYSNFNWEYLMIIQHVTMSTI